MIGIELYCDVPPRKRAPDCYSNSVPTKAPWMVAKSNSMEGCMKRLAIIATIQGWQCKKDRWTCPACAAYAARKETVNGSDTHELVDA